MASTSQESCSSPHPRTQPVGFPLHIRDNGQAGRKHLQETPHEIRNLTRRDEPSIQQHQQNPWVLLSPPETSGALGALGALRPTSAPPGTWGVNLFPLEGSRESRRALESPGKLWRAQESPGESRRVQ